MQNDFLNLSIEEQEELLRAQQREMEITKFILERFKTNYNLLALESGRGLAKDVVESALEQVRVYWLKMRGVAETVTETEVKLTLPNQKTPKGRKYMLEGVVDIVREKEHTAMHDIKTHQAEDVATNRAYYEKQLNVYAHIWQTLRNQPLHETAIIATAYPPALREARFRKDQALINEELEKWNPKVDIPFSQEQVQETIKQFGETIDKIEEGIFQPPPQKKLTEQDSAKRTFATRTCQNCDARFSCDAYRSYKRGNQGEQALFKMFQEAYTNSTMQSVYWKIQNAPDPQDQKYLLD